MGWRRTDTLPLRYVILWIECTVWTPDPFFTRLLYYTIADAAIVSHRGFIRHGVRRSARVTIHILLLGVGRHVLRVVGH